MPPAAPGTFQASWSDMVELEPSTPDAAPAGPAAGSKRRRLAGRQPKASPAGGPAGSSSAASASGQGWLPQAEQVVRRFDAQLEKALAAALDACGGTGGKPHSAAGIAEAAASRALVLEPFVQDRCAACLRLTPVAALTSVESWHWVVSCDCTFLKQSALPCRCAEAAEGIAAALDARLLALPRHQASSSETAAAAYASTATQALILGRIALGLASRSSMLPLVLGPPDQWRTAGHGGRGTGASGRRAAGMASAAGAAAVPSPRYERLQQRLHSVGLQAYGAWASWASQGLSTALIAGLAADQTLLAAVPLRAWEETVVSGIPPGSPEKAGDEAPAAGAGEMRFQLPATPSPAAVQLALAACQEADHAGEAVGGHVRGGAWSWRPYTEQLCDGVCYKQSPRSARSRLRCCYGHPWLAGGHLLEDEALLLLKWQLGGAVLAALHAELAADEASSSGGAAGDAATTTEQQQAKQQHLGSRLSEKGVLQLLFDVRFLLDLLAGGLPPRWEEGDLWQGFAVLLV